MDVNLIAAVGENGELGLKGDLIWHIPEDLKHFKALTMGRTVIMGRKTWDSLPKKPLPGRKNIIITSQKDYQAEGAQVVNSIPEALSLTAEESPFIIGGAEIYDSFLPFCSRLHLTRVQASCPEADAFLKINLSDDWILEDESDIKLSPEGVPYKYMTYRRCEKIGESLQ